MLTNPNLYAILLTKIWSVKSAKGSLLPTSTIPINRCVLSQSASIFARFPTKEPGELRIRSILSVGARKDREWRRVHKDYLKEYQRSRRQQRREYMREYMRKYRVIRRKKK